MTDHDDEPDDDGELERAAAIADRLDAAEVNPFALVLPRRIEPRGPAPAHHDAPPPGSRLLTGPEAIAAARRNLAEWVAAHPGADDAE
jgi:hypothetical protein